MLLMKVKIKKDKTVSNMRAYKIARKLVSFNNKVNSLAVFQSQKQSHFINLHLKQFDFIQ